MRKVFRMRNFIVRTRRNTKILFVFLSVLILGSCAGFKIITIETQEPARISFQQNVQSILIVNNVVEQPKDIGHNMKRLGKSYIERVAVSSDSMAIYYTEALSQFLEEGGFFNKVLYYNKSLRTDNDFWSEKPISPGEVERLTGENDVDAIISLDKLIITTNGQEYYRQSFFTDVELIAKLQSIFRVYIPLYRGEELVMQHVDSLRYEGFIPSQKQPQKHSLFFKDYLKDMVVNSAEKMTEALAPHWKEQERWLYTLANGTMQDGEFYANQNKWDEAAIKWQEFYNNNTKTINRAKAASNIALAYEMMGDIERAYKWISTSYKLFEESSNSNSEELLRTLLYKNELERRYNNEGILDLQIHPIDNIYNQRDEIQLKNEE